MFVRRAAQRVTADDLEFTPKGGPKTCRHNFNHSWWGWLSNFVIWRPFREVKHFTVTKINEDSTLSKPWYLVERKDPPKYLSKSVVLHFRCSRRNKAFCTFQYGTREGITRRKMENYEMLLPMVINKLRLRSLG